MAIHSVIAMGQFSKDKIIRAGNTELLLCFFLYLDQLQIEYDPIHLKRFLNHLYLSSGYFDQCDFERYQVMSPNLKQFLSLWQASLRNAELIVLQDSVNNMEQICAAEKDRFLQSLNVSQITYRNSFDFERFTELVKDKRLLIVSPFAKLMQAQYDSGNLQYVRSPFKPASLAIYPFPYLFNDKRSADSLQALSSITAELDVLLAQSPAESVVLSCGCYGAPLADHLHRQGLNAYYFGGDLQIYFGIMGGRWKANIEKQAWFLGQKQYWVLELAHEYLPEHPQTIENACYW